jgi:hypothetical protein
LQDRLAVAGRPRGFAYGLRRARLVQVLNDARFSHLFARAYVGIDA